MKSKVCLFVPADTNNDKFYTDFVNSVRKFHSEEELPIFRNTGEPRIPDFWYKAKPILAKDLIDRYEFVIGADADQIVLGPLNELWEGDFDVATVLNDPTYPAGVWDIKPYFNNGLVVLKSKEFIEHWYRLCMSAHFPMYQFREQDILNILCSDYMNYKVKCLDIQDKIYGEFAKPAWTQAEVIDGKVMIEEKQLMMIHFGGGADPNKGNYRIRFQPDVIAKIEELIK